MKFSAFVVGLAASVSLIGCSAGRSSIVKQYEDSKGGAAAAATINDMALYLRNHADLEAKLRQPCAVQSATTKGDWLQSDEGKVCTAVRLAAFGTPVTEDKSDKSVY